MSRIEERKNIRGTKQYKVLTETFNAPTLYTTGGTIYNSTVLRQLERATAMQIQGGYIGEVVTGSVSGNAFKMKIYVTSGVATGAAELPSSTNLGSNAVTVLIEGF